jgi:hypothetical protein
MTPQNYIMKKRPDFDLKTYRFKLKMHSDEKPPFFFI